MLQLVFSEPNETESVQLSSVFQSLQRLLFKPLVCRRPIKSGVRDLAL
jgi:hypothetical protein